MSTAEIPDGYMVPLIPDDGSFLSHFQRPTPRTLVVVGDSLTEQGGQVAGNVQRTVESFWPWGLNLLGQRLELVANLGIGSEITGDILARINDAIDLAPGWIHILAGTNDVGAGVPVATMIANLSAMYNAVQSAGIRLIVGTIPPRTSATTQQKNDATALNQWIRDQSAVRAGVILCDYEAALLNPATNGYPTAPTSAQWSGDGVHMKALSGHAAGRVFANALSSHVPTGSPLAAQPGALNLLGASGRFFLGTGSPAAGWQQSQYAVLPTNSTPARTDEVYGTWQQAIVPVGDKVFYHNNVTVDGVTLSVGDTVEMLVEYEATGLDPAPAANTAWITAKTQLYIGGSFNGANMRYDLWSSTGSPNHPVTTRSGVFRTPPLTILASTDLVQCLIEARGGGTYRWGRTILRKV